jgi:hypothetical protein
MSVESDVSDVFALILKKNASQETARAAALALCRELMPLTPDHVIRETVARAIATVRIERAARNDNRRVGKKAQPVNKS